MKDYKITDPLIKQAVEEMAEECNIAVTFQGPPNGPWLATSEPLSDKVELLFGYACGWRHNELIRKLQLN